MIPNENSTSRSEKDIAKAICESFSRDGYLCRFNYPLNVRGVKFIPDVFCEKNKERVVIEIKKAASVNDRDVQQLVLYSRFLANFRWYLCIPSSTKLRRHLRNTLEQSNIGLILFEKGRIKMKSVAVSYTEMTNRWRNSLRTMQREREERIPSAALKGISREEQEALNKLRERLGQIAYRQSTIEAERVLESSYLNTLLGYQQKLAQTDIILKESTPVKLRVSSELLDQVSELQNISYTRDLVRFEQRYRKADSFDREYQIVLETLKNLWTRYEKERGAAAFKSFKDFEPLLMEIPGYRDHMIHPFQVFLMGSIIIDKFYEDFLKSYKLKLQNADDGDLDFAWLLCSTFHDFCYPIQMYEFINQRLFKKFLQMEDTSVLPRLQTEKILLQKGQLKLLDQLISLCCHCMNDPKNNKWTFDTECKIDDNLRFTILQEIANKKNHAPLSALTLLNMISGEEVATTRKRYIEKTFSTAIFPAALAIALHDTDVLRNLPKDGNITFESMPITLLLIYCDTAQEFGRSEHREYCSLKSLDFGKNLVETSLAFSKKSVYRKKAKEVEFVMNKLKSSRISFKLRLIFEEEEFSKATGQTV